MESPINKNGENVKLKKAIASMTNMYRIEIGKESSTSLKNKVDQPDRAFSKLPRLNSKK